MLDLCGQLFRYCIYTCLSHLWYSSCLYFCFNVSWISYCPSPVVSKLSCCWRTIIFFWVIKEPHLFIAVAHTAFQIACVHITVPRIRAGYNSFLFRIPTAGFDPQLADDTSFEADALLTKPPRLDQFKEHRFEMLHMAIVMRKCIKELCKTLCCLTWTSYS